MSPGSLASKLCFTLSFSYAKWRWVGNSNTYFIVWIKHCLVQSEYSINLSCYWQPSQLIPCPDPEISSPVCVKRESSTRSSGESPAQAPLNRVGCQCCLYLVINAAKSLPSLSLSFLTSESSLSPSPHPLHSLTCPLAWLGCDPSSCPCAPWAPAPPPACLLYTSDAADEERLV